MNKPLHILRFGTIGDRKHLECQKDNFDCIAINGNSLAYISASISKFIIENIVNIDGKSFFIDPITYAFQNNLNLLQNKNNEIKQSIQKLIDCYGEPLSSKIPNNIITPEDFADEKESFCKKVLSFQADTVKNYATENEIYEYLEFEIDEQENLEEKICPKFLIAPYFYLNSEDKRFCDWLGLNLEFIEIAVNQAELDMRKTPIYAQIVLSQSTLKNVEARNKVAEAYRSLKCQGFTIWIDSLNEHDCNDSELLESFVDFLSKLKEKNKNRVVYNMYGGYFSTLLMHEDVGVLDGVSHGLEYGESRAVYPVGGGIPVSKYYFLPLHQRLDFTQAFDLLKNTGYIDVTKSDWGNSEAYYKDICNCEQCNKIIESQMLNFYEFESSAFYEVKNKNFITRRKKATRETKENCLYHFLYSKSSEFADITTKNLLEIIELLENAAKKFSYISNPELNSYPYIDIWVKILRQIK